MRGNYIFFRISNGDERLTRKKNSVARVLSSRDRRISNYQFSITKHSWNF